MKRGNFLIFLSAMMMMTEESMSPPKPEAVYFEWRAEASLPTEGGRSSVGVAGAVNGVSGGAFIVAGGSDFPHGMPWDGGKKVYTDRVCVLLREGGSCVWDRKVTARLPEKIAYCGYTSTEKGLVYAGGENENGSTARAYLLRWDSLRRQVSISPLPDLPAPLTNVSLTHMGSTVYAVGGDSGHHSCGGFYCLDLNDTAAGWRPLPDLPVALANCTTVAMENGGDARIYVVGGRTRTPSGISRLHHTTFAFDAGAGRWQKLADISDGRHVMNLSAAPGVALDGRYIAVFGGDNGIVFHEIETLMAERAEAPAGPGKDSLSSVIKDLNVHHKGFYKGILLYDTRTDSWSQAGTLPFAAHVTTSAVWWDGRIILADGEIRPGVRTPEVMAAIPRITASGR